MSDVVKGAAIGIGDVEITIAGERKVLKPSFRAAQTLSRQFNGLSGLVSRVVVLDMDVMAAIISAGLGLTDKGREGLEEKLYNSGLNSLASPCILYVTNLANGGQPVKEKSEEGEDSGKGNG